MSILKEFIKESLIQKLTEGNMFDGAQTWLKSPPSGDLGFLIKEINKYYKIVEIKRYEDDLVIRCEVKFGDDAKLIVSDLIKTSSKTVENILKKMENIPLTLVASGADENKDYLKTSKDVWDHSLVFVLTPKTVKAEVEKNFSKIKTILKSKSAEIKWYLHKNYWI